MVTNSSSVANYYSEVSFGQEQLNITVVPDRLGAVRQYVAGGGEPDPTNSTISTPADASLVCAATLSTGADTAATYQNRYYVFRYLNSCRHGLVWLAYVGYGVAYSNGYNTPRRLRPRARPQLRPAACGQACAARARSNAPAAASPSTAIRSTSWATSMSAVTHFNAAQKSILQWIPATSVKTHTQRDRHLHVVADRIAPAAPAMRSRFRPPPIAPTGSNIGSRSVSTAASSAYPNNGAQIRVSSPVRIDLSAARRYRIARHDASDEYVHRRGAASRTELHRQYVRDHDHRRLGVACRAQRHGCGRGRPVPTTTTLDELSQSIGVRHDCYVHSQRHRQLRRPARSTFKDGGSSISGCSAVALSGSGNSGRRVRDQRLDRGDA